MAEGGDFFGVGGDDDLGELGARLGGFVDPGEHGASGDDAKDFAGQAGGGEARGDDAEDGGFRFIHLAWILVRRETLTVILLILCSVSF